jgi:hypothetical protein
MTRALERYLELVDQLLWRRAVEGQLSEDDEESFATALNDTRHGMTADEELSIGDLIAARREIVANPKLGFDLEPPATEDGPLRTEAA